MRVAAWMPDPSTVASEKMQKITRESESPQRQTLDASGRLVATVPLPLTGCRQRHCQANRQQVR